MNRLTLVGRLTRDPELRITATGKDVCNLRLAVDGRSDADTLFINVATFGAQAQACAQYLAKGRQVSFDGRLTYQEWDAQDGTRRHTYSGIGHVGFLGSTPVQDTPVTEPTGGSSLPVSGRRHDHDPEDDIPF